MRRVVSTIHRVIWKNKGIIYNVNNINNMNRGAVGANQVLFFDKLPPQVCTILAGFPQPTLELTAQGADDIINAISLAPFFTSNPAQLRQN